MWTTSAHSGLTVRSFFNGFRALYGEHAEVVARIEGNSELLSDFVELCRVFFAGRAVGHDAVLGFGFVGAVNDQVVNYAAVVVEQSGIKGFADKSEFGDIVGNQFAEKGFGICACYVVTSIWDTSNIPASVRTASCSAICEP